MKNVIKTSVPSLLKIEFKTRCVENGITISRKLEKSILDLINTNPDIPTKLDVLDESGLKSDDKFVVVKGYIPESLKRQFHAFCVERGISMTLVLRYLIRTSVESNNHS